ncbi:MAG TPA: PSD1 and planctomycete cytochrome C domain-containing protein [Pirellulales bacterium]|nr:PSD1 and planctomycete cytochrome C domain-containing protein [Pirellulales bacterium]
MQVRAFSRRVAIRIRQLNTAALVAILLCTAGGTAAHGQVTETPSRRASPKERKIDFARDIQPIFAKHCYSCHGPESEESGFRLDARERALAGGDYGPAIVKGKSDKSPLAMRIAGLGDDERMPPEGGGKPLSTEQVALLRAWIDQGAFWPDAANAATKRAGSDHWSFQPIVRPAVPEVINQAWVRNPIDAFILARLDRERVSPAPEADKYTLIRRVTIDLIGLPPTPAEVDEFVGDTSSTAYEKVVDRLLASPHYGERYGRYWLDLARYADTDGYEKDLARPHAWRYRDWVIHALNSDMPFDKFTVLQLAGDLVPDATVDRRSAAGFHRNTLTNREGGADPEEDRTKQTVDRTNTTGTVWLGLTVGCANCHTHKYDPITQREYFGLYGFFNNVEEVDIALDGGGDKPIRMGDVRNDSPRTTAREFAPGIAEREEPRENYVHVRGDFLTKGPVIEPHTPEVLPPLKPRGEKPDRLDLARWIVDPANPLTARVAANRFWQWHFGRGLVNTGDDFGTQGEPPSHAELLDWLASELRDSGWQIKPLHKLIVMSATYRQSSAARPELYERDPYNTWLARQNRLRFEAEIVRDAALAASGLLNGKIGGASVRPPQPPEIAALSYAGSVRWVESKGPDRYRRGLYTWFQRTSPYPTLMTFDAPDSNLTCTRRERSNTPLQALTLLNDIVFVECAQALARRILQEPMNDLVAADGTGGGEPAVVNEAVVNARLRFAFKLALNREATDSELSHLRTLYSEARAAFEKDEESAKKLAGDSAPATVPIAEAAAWTLVARTLTNLDEFITRE